MTLFIMKKSQKCDHEVEEVGVSEASFSVFTIKNTLSSSLLLSPPLCHTSLYLLSPSSHLPSFHDHTDKKHD